MAETIRFAVVRWNPEAKEARALVIEETRTLVNGHAVRTVRESSGPVVPTWDWDVNGVCNFFASRLQLNNAAVAVVEVAYAP
jgi:hypothetical protein